MKVVLSFNDNIVYVTFDRKYDDPWTVLQQVTRDIPQVIDKSVKFMRKIPESNSYTLWEMNGNGSSVEQTTELKKAVRFLKPKKTLRTLGELLQKYASK